jgi:hypothetical protein
MSKRKCIGIERGRMVNEIDGARVSLPPGDHPLDTVPHVVRAYLDPVERAAFETMMGVGKGCSKATVYTLEEALRPYTGTDPTAEELAHPEAANIGKTLAEIASIVNNLPGSRLARFPQYKTPTYIPPGPKLSCYIRGLESALLPIGGSLGDYGGRARPVRDSEEDTDECWLNWYRGLNAAARLSRREAFPFISELKRLNAAPAEKRRSSA